jgi:ubiquinone/menaquinone biosynthesis C-methylase UbiE
MAKRLESTRQKTTPAFDDANKLDLRNEIQERYGKQPAPWFRWVFNALVDLPARSRVLELGAGTGALWRENSDRIPAGWKVLVSDPAEAMIQSARDRAGGQKRSTMQYLRSLGQTLPFPAQSLDAVIAVGVLDLASDLPQALSEVRRALKPGGLFLATAGGAGHLQEFEALLRPYLPHEQAEMIGGEEDRFGLENGARLLEPYFERIIRRNYPDRMTFRAIQPVLDYIFSELSLVKDLPVHHLGDIGATVWRAIEQQGAYTVTVRKGMFLARRPAAD